MGGFITESNFFQATLIGRACREYREQVSEKLNIDTA